MSRDPDSLVELTAFRTSLEAHLFAARLEEAGIRVAVFGTIYESTGLFGADMMHGGVEVRVRHADLDAARRLLDAFQAERAGEDEEE